MVVIIAHRCSIAGLIQQQNVYEDKVQYNVTQNTGINSILACVWLQKMCIGYCALLQRNGD